MKKFTREDIVQGVYFTATMHTSGKSHKMLVERIDGELINYIHTIDGKPWPGQTHINGLVDWLAMLQKDYLTEVTKHLPTPKRSRRAVLEDM